MSRILQVQCPEALGWVGGRPDLQAIGDRQQLCAHKQPHAQPPRPPKRSRASAINLVSPDEQVANGNLAAACGDRGQWRGARLVGVAVPLQQACGGQRAGPRGSRGDSSWARHPGRARFGGQGGAAEGCSKPKTAPGTGQQRRRGRGGERRHRGGVRHVGGAGWVGGLFFKMHGLRGGAYPSQICVHVCVLNLIILL